MKIFTVDAPQSWAIFSVGEGEEMTVNALNATKRKLKYTITEETESTFGNDFASEESRVMKNLDNQIT